jgi:hypothetical protein
MVPTVLYSMYRSADTETDCLAGIVFRALSAKLDVICSLYI